ncbi:YaaW family protein [Nodosilinea nodulosa]|uniref:YaaW family protein n=1 Tax=Nodosilinea nodulosa TaxID=416001 RepID=UPI0002E2FC50|nr:YaaW family protein [Nodosilinea nodulosa]
MDELRSALELATDEELLALTDMLFRPRFNPLDYLQNPAPLTAQAGSRQQWLDRLERRFRFLAADGLTVINGQSQRITYRQVLIQVCNYLKLPYGKAWSTDDLEAEVFLHLLRSNWRKLPQAERDRLHQSLKQSLAGSARFEALPLDLQTNPLSLLAKGSGVVAVSAVLQPWLLQQIARQMAFQMARYEVARQAVMKGGGTVVAQIQQRVVLNMASRGVAASAARYGATRAVFSVLGPALWGWLLADLGWRAVATNYSRVIPVVFTLAQIRLTRSFEDWELALG